MEELLSMTTTDTFRALFVVGLASRDDSDKG